MASNKEYGYARISTAKQSIDRQIRNIKAAFPAAIIIQEAYTGTKVEGRKEFEKLLRQAQKEAAQGVKVSIIFDSVSRMSRNAEEGITLYQDLFAQGIELVFLKEPHINTSVYKEAIEKQIDTVATGDAATDELMAAITNGINRYMMRLAEKQIEIAFFESAKEVEDLHQRTKEGLETARLNGKQIGLAPGTKLTTKKSVASKKIIVKHSKDFNGSLDDSEVMTLTGLARNTYYKYKREIREAESQTCETCKYLDECPEEYKQEQPNWCENWEA